MPICQQINFKHSHYVVWKITESLDELIALLPDYIDISEKLNATKNDKRKFELVCEHLLIHHLLQKAFELCHKENGAPYIKDSCDFISISHTIGYVAVGIADTKIGMDIEIFRDKVLNITDKFLSEDEKKHVNTQTFLEPLIIWCCKESIFKYCNLPLLDFTKDINLSKIQPPFSRVKFKNQKTDPLLEHEKIYDVGGIYFNGEFWFPISLFAFITRDYVLTFTTEECLF